MSDVVVTVMVPYRQCFIRYKHRRTERTGLWTEHRASVPLVEPQAAPIAYRIVPVAGEHRKDSYPGCAVRKFEGRFWWPLLDANGPVASDDFISLAAKGSERVSLAFGCPLDMPYSAKRTLDDFLAEHPKCRLRDSTLDGQVKLVEHGAARLVFCGGEVFIAAGQPVYYACESYKTDDIEILAGPSSLDGAPGAGYRLFGPNLDRRRMEAAEGFAYGTDELRKLQDLLAERKKSPRLVSRIETLLKDDLDVAPQVCARALAERLWRGTASDSSWDHRWLRRYVPTLAKAGDPGASIDGLCHRRTLEEFVAVDWTFTDQLSLDVSAAHEILRRLDETEHFLSKEDADALSSLRI